MHSTLEQAEIVVSTIIWVVAASFWAAASRMPAVQGISPPDLGATAAGCAYSVSMLRGDFHTVNASLACLSGSGIICTAYTPDASANSPYTGCHTCPCPRNTPRLQQKCSCAHGHCMQASKMIMLASCTAPCKYAYKCLEWLF